MNLMNRVVWAALSVAALSFPASANSVTLGAQLDNTLYEESNSESNGLGDGIFAGVNGLGQIRRGLIQFNVAGSIPAGSTITNVQLVLFMSKSNAGPLNVDLHRCLAQWGEGTSNAPSGEGGGQTATNGDATWGLRVFPSLSWTTAGGDFSPTISSTQLVGGVGSYTWPSTPALVADVQSFLDSPSTNFGWVLVNSDELSAPTAKRFWSRNYVTASVRPALIVDYTPPGQPTAFCFGDGTGTACPCANSGATGRGCANSVDPNGGFLTATGTASVSLDTFVLQGSGMPNGSALYFQGTNAVNGGSGVIFGDGLRCAGGTVVRLAVKTNLSGASAYPSLVDFPISVKAGTVAGQVARYQCWYRDSATFCSASLFNLTNGVQVTWIP